MKHLIITLILLTQYALAQHSRFEQYLTGYGGNQVTIIELGTTDTTRLVESRTLDGYYFRDNVKFGNYKLLIADTTFIDTIMHGRVKENQMINVFNTNGTIDGSVIVDTLTGNVLEGTYINGSVITGGTIQTAQTGQRIVIDGATNRINFYDADSSVGYMFGSNANVYVQGILRLSSSLKIFDGDVGHYTISGSVYGLEFDANLNAEGLSVGGTLDDPNANINNNGEVNAQLYKINGTSGIDSIYTTGNADSLTIAGGIITKMVIGTDGLNGADTTGYECRYTGSVYSKTLQQRAIIITYKNGIATLRTLGSWEDVE